MYAINHAATALLLKKEKPSVSIWPLLISVQFVEVLWVIFNYMGIEHFTITEGKLHLSYLPYSHSLFSGILLAVLSYVIIRWVIKNKPLAFVFAIGVVSHVVIDVVFHEKDIRLSPFSATPVWGFGIIDHPIINFILETAYGVFCWSYFGGNRSLLVVIIIFNVLDLPVMLAHGKALTLFVNYPFLLPTFILIQIVLTWYFVAKYSRRKQISGQKKRREFVLKGD
jgi:hypothetical protein